MHSPDSSRSKFLSHQEVSWPQAEAFAVRSLPDWAAPTQKMWPLSHDPARRTNRSHEAPPSPFGPHEVEVRHRVASQLRLANTQRLFTAMERARAGEQTLAAHGVSLFYTGPDPFEAMGFRVHAVSRWGYSGPEYDDLPRMLQGLHASARKFIAAAAAAGQRWDPRGPGHPLVNVGDLPMARESTRYIGVGIETLDTGHQRWTDLVDMQRRIHPAAATRALRNVPCEAVALLVDGSELHVVHDNNKPMGYNGVRSSRTPSAGQARGPARHLSEGLGETLRRAWPDFAALSQTLRDCSAR